METAGERHWIDVEGDVPWEETKLCVDVAFREDLGVCGFWSVVLDDWNNWVNIFLSSSTWIDVDNDGLGSLANTLVQSSSGDIGLSFGMKEASNAADEESNWFWGCRERDREGSQSTADLDIAEDGSLGECGLWKSLCLGDPLWSVCFPWCCDLIEAGAELFKIAEVAIFWHSWGVRDETLSNGGGCKNWLSIVSLSDLKNLWLSFGLQETGNAGCWHWTDVEINGLQVWGEVEEQESETCVVPLSADLDFDGYFDTCGFRSFGNCALWGACSL